MIQASCADLLCPTHRTITHRLDNFADSFAFASSQRRENASTSELIERHSRQQRDISAELIRRDIGKRSPNVFILCHHSGDIRRHSKAQPFRQNDFAHLKEARELGRRQAEQRS